MVNNFDVCYYDDIAIHFDAFGVASYVTTHFVTRLTVVYWYAYLHCKAPVFDSNATQQDKY